MKMFQGNIDGRVFVVEVGDVVRVSHGDTYIEFEASSVPNLDVREIFEYLEFYCSQSSGMEYFTSEYLLGYLNKCSN